MTTPSSVKLIAETEVLIENIAKYYIEEVMRRGHNFVPSEQLLDNIKAVACWLNNTATKPGLLITGGVGCGKSTIMNAIYRVIKRYVKQAGGFSEDIKAIKAQNITSVFADDITKSHYYYAKWLFIDDLGCDSPVVNNYGTKTTPMSDLLCERYEKQLPTIITTNLSSEDILKIYGERIVDRLNEMCNKIIYKNKSYRI
jgi:DNA replication protein DnaC